MSMSRLPNGLISFGPDANCTLDTCPLEASILRYQPSIPANAVFAGVFGLSLIIHAFQGIRMRTWGFMASMIAGINHVDPTISRFPPQYFYWIFIPSDIISLILQAVGGALSCVASTHKDVKTGEDISLAGLIFQVVTLICFCALFIDYVIKASKSSSRGRLDKPIVTFLAFLFASTIFILIRCGYRIAELGQGYFSALFRDEDLYIALESCMMCIAVLLLNAGHPGYAFRKRQEFSEKNQDQDLP
ncbi:hypothetical protein NW766_008812 [Fusarium irregulare]|uniref:Sphingoid long-chain base transporter RSB1 n=1 Tax=Fusarium irregulare TaxID=2494466 RepID=A0A9W8U881_9HYPO|nr:hypothetical protein NW766_008812 [Fusarium irregulare]